jgi:hypothetical protein
MNIIDRILKSKYTTIAHNSQSEYQTIKLINLIPNRIEFGVNYVINEKTILDFFYSNSYIRDYKISSILNEELPSNIIVNLSNIIKENEDSLTLNRSLVKNLQSIVYSLNNSESLAKHNLIFVSTSYTSLDKLHIKGGNILTYSSELVIFLIDDNIIIEKDRDQYQNEKKSYNLNSEIREISINKILNK